MEEERDRGAERAGSIVAPLDWHRFNQRAITGRDHWADPVPQSDFVYALCVLGVFVLCVLCVYLVVCVLCVVRRLSA